MPTLMIMGNSEGERRCDAKCYNATSSKCDCCYGGANHGKGFKAALENTRQVAEKIIEKYEATTGRKVERLIFGKEVQNLGLFDE